jgi:hypothetical protein
MIIFLIIVGAYAYLMYGMFVLTEINKQRVDDWHWIIKIVFILTYPIWLFISLFATALRL